MLIAMLFIVCPMSTSSAAPSSHQKKSRILVAEEGWVVDCPESSTGSKRAAQMLHIRSTASRTTNGSLTKLLKQIVNNQSLQAQRGIAQIPHWEYHIRFDPKVGRKRPCQDVLDRFKRLNNGLWIRAHPGRNKLRYAKDDTFLKTSYYFETCSKEQCEMLDRMMTPFWLRPKYYVDDPYQPYNVRHGIKSPRIGLDGKFARERPKILLEDCVADRYFRDR